MTGVEDLLSESCMIWKRRAGPGGGMEMYVLLARALANELMPYIMTRPV